MGEGRKVDEGKGLGVGIGSTHPRRSWGQLLQCVLCSLGHLLLPAGGIWTES